VPYSSNRPATPPPTMEVIDGDEDWDNGEYDLID